MKKFIAIILCSLTLCFSCKKKEETVSENENLDGTEMELISVKNGKFFKGDQPYYFVGANYWYGPLLGSKAHGDRERLVKELDLMKSLGIDNLRILAGAEGTGDYRVKPALQPEQGEYDKELLDGLDFLLSEMRKRHMYAVIYLNNNWLWSGGMAQYLEWNGYGPIPNPRVNSDQTWEDYMTYTMQFHSCDPCKKAYYEHIEILMSRTNPYTALPYIKDNTIMSWQVANEPRVMISPSYEAAYTEWLNTTVNLIQTLDPIHLISTGSEGKASYLQDISMYEKIHENEHIDYLTAHVWPKNWEWYDVHNEETSTDHSMEMANAYLDEHLAVAKSINKPVVLSEFGFPREGENLTKGSSVVYRDAFYKSLFSRIVDSKNNNGYLAGLNFWGFAGYAEPNLDSNGKWMEGDDFSADPPQEPQGLNSVFASDTSTLNLIKDVNAVLTAK